MAAVCPHCGFTQEESVAAKSTFCRKCQQHYNLERMLAGEKSIVKEPSLFSKLTRLVLGDRQRQVTCFTCGGKQTLSKEAQSTMCPDCGAYMDLRDFKISGPFGRSVQTAGDVYVTSKGDVTSTRLMCGTVYLEGSLRGCIICTGTATLQFKGRLSGTLDSAHILVEKKSDVEFPRPVHTKLFEVSGKARGEIVADKVVINKGGTLEGTVHAKAITVDKGGIFSGSLNIGGGEAAEDEAPTESEAGPEAEGAQPEGEAYFEETPEAETHFEEVPQTETHFEEVPQTETHFEEAAPSETHFEDAATTEAQAPVEEESQPKREEPANPKARGGKSASGKRRFQDGELPFDS